MKLFTFVKVQFILDTNSIKEAIFQLDSIQYPLQKFPIQARWSFISINTWIYFIHTKSSTSQISIKIFLLGRNPYQVIDRNFNSFGMDFMAK